MSKQRKTPKRQKDKWRPKFLEILRDTGNVRLACEQAGIGRQFAYACRNDDPEFAKQWQDALEDACDTLDGEARRRALETSDALLMFLLRSHRPGVYRETVRQEHTGADGKAIEQVVFYVPDNGRDTPPARPADDGAE